MTPTLMHAWGSVPWRLVDLDLVKLFPYEHRRGLNMSKWVRPCTLVSSRKVKLLVNRGAVVDRRLKVYLVCRTCAGGLVDLPLNYRGRTISTGCRNGPWNVR